MQGKQSHFNISPQKAVHDLSTCSFHSVSDVTSPGSFTAAEQGNAIETGYVTFLILNTGYSTTTNSTQEQSWS